MSSLVLNAVDCHKEKNRSLLEGLIERGWSVDRFGHATKSFGNNKYRYKFQRLVIRKEIQVVVPASRWGKEEKLWRRVSTISYKNAKLAEVSHEG